MISFRNVTRRYNIDEETVIEPVKDVTLDILKGEFIMIIGRSGSGKTTLLNLTAGLIKPSSGQVLIDGINIERMKDRELSFLRSRKIGFVFQFPSLLPSLSVMDNVVLPHTFISRHGKHEANVRAKKLLEQMGLANKMGTLPRRLSAGEQKRVVIARALINEPEILLADEPTSDLDEKTESEILSIMLGIRAAGVTLVMVTHNLQLAPNATRAYKMEGGVCIPVSTHCCPR